MSGVRVSHLPPSTHKQNQRFIFVAPDNATLSGRRQFQRLNNSGGHLAPPNKAHSCESQARSFSGGRIPLSGPVWQASQMVDCPQQRPAEGKWREGQPTRLQPMRNSTCRAHPDITNAGTAVAVSGQGRIDRSYFVLPLTFLMPCSCPAISDRPPAKTSIWRRWSLAVCHSTFSRRVSNTERMPSRLDFVDSL